MVERIESAFCATLRRDLLIALRRPGEIANPLVFFVIVIALFPLGIGPTPTDLARIARMLRSEIEGTPLADWRRAANMLGIHLKTADAIGLGPVLDLSQDPQPTAEVDVTGGPDPVIVDHYTSLARIADA